MSRTKKINCRTEVQNVQGSSSFPKYSSNSIIYQGLTNECMGVCTNSTLTSVIQVILEDLCEVNSFLDSDNYEICEAIEKEIREDYNFKDLFQILLNRSCSIEDMKTDIENVLGDTKRIVLNLKCLKDRVDNDDCGDYTPFVLRTILQLLIDAHCDLQLEFTNLKAEISDYITSEINNAINNISILDQLPIGSIIPYNGPLNLFDNTGKGLGSLSKYAIANGANGTTDYRGFTLVGVQNGVGGGSLDVLVNSTNYSMNDKGGLVQNVINNLPLHSHGMSGTISVSSSSLPVTDYEGFPGSEEVFVVRSVPPNRVRSKTITLGNLSHNLSVSNAGSNANQTYNNRMPYKAVVFIQKIA